MKKKIIVLSIVGTLMIPQFIHAKYEEGAVVGAVLLGLMAWGVKSMVDDASSPHGVCLSVCYNDYNPTDYPKSYNECTDKCDYKHSD